MPAPARPALAPLAVSLRAALAALDCGRADVSDVADAFAADPAAYNRGDLAREAVSSAAGLAWLRGLVGGAP